MAVPTNDRIASIFIDHPAVFNTLHYVDFEGRDVLESLTKVTHLAGPRMHALQLDMVWPDPEALKAYRAAFPNVQTILQINPPALDKLENLQGAFVEKVGSYQGLVDFVSLDKSMGRGIGLDANFLRPLLKEIREHYPQFNLAVAGGLGPDTLGLVEPLVREFTGLSIDAQGRLRPSGSTLDPVDWSLARAYLEKSLDLFYG